MRGVEPLVFGVEWTVSTTPVVLNKCHNFLRLTSVFMFRPSNSHKAVFVSSLVHAVIFISYLYLLSSAIGLVVKI